MANYGTYASLDDIRIALGYKASDTVDDPRVLATLEAASRWIDRWCQRHFYVVSQTRYYTARYADRLILDDDEPDLLSVTSLKTDEDDDYDYDYTWAASDYHLMPFNGFPKWELRVTANGNYAFPSNERGVEITGMWGYGDGQSATPYEASGTTTSEELDANETAVDLVDGSKVQVGQALLIGSEQIYVIDVSSNVATVKRGVNGTTAAIHATGQTIYIYRYPDAVREACLLEAIRLYRRKDAPFGVAGSGEFGQTGIVARTDPQVLFYLAPYRRIAVA